MNGFHHERFVRFMAPYPGLWVEIGALEDARLLRRPRRARRELGLPADYLLKPRRVRADAARVEG